MCIHEWNSSWAERGKGCALPPFYNQLMKHTIFQNEGYWQAATIISKVVYSFNSAILVQTCLFKQLQEQVVTVTVWLLLNSKTLWAMAIKLLYLKNTSVFNWNQQVYNALSISNCLFLAELCNSYAFYMEKFLGWNLTQKDMGMMWGWHEILWDFMGMTYVITGSSQFSQVILVVPGFSPWFPGFTSHAQAISMFPRSSPVIGDDFRSSPWSLGCPCGLQWLGMTSVYPHCPCVIPVIPRSCPLTDIIPRSSLSSPVTGHDPRLSPCHPLVIAVIPRQ